jgi:acetylornithine deacetylase
MVPAFKQLHRSKPIHFALTYDEEIGCIGVNPLVQYLKKNNIQPEGCIVGEPSLLKPIIGEKSRRLYHCQVKGKAGHSSRLDRGCNAIEYASRLICYIHRLARKHQKNGPFDQDFDFPSVSITVNIISGGIASNIIPDNCEFILEFRYFKKFKITNFMNQIKKYAERTLLADMKKSYPNADIYIDKISNGLGFNGTEGSRIIKTVRKITGVEKTMKVSYSTEARAYQQANIPAIIFGPGNIAQAHSANEFIEIEQLVLFNGMLYDIVREFC